jgi:hypothetical protein
VNDIEADRADDVHHDEGGEDGKDLVSLAQNENDKQDTMAHEAKNPKKTIHCRQWHA